MELSCSAAEAALTWAGEQNAGNWISHSRFTAFACKNIAARCEGMDAELAYCFGLLHDIGRYAGVCSERHLVEGYRFCMDRGWEKAAQICISHAFMIQDIHTSIGTFDVAEDDFCFMKKSSRTQSTMIMTVSCSCATHWHCLMASVFWKSVLLM